MRARGQTATAALRIAFGGALIFLVGWALQVRPRLPPVRSAQSPIADGLFVVVFIVLALVMFAVTPGIRIRRRRRREPDDEIVSFTPSVWSRVLAILTVGAMLAISVLVLVELSRREALLKGGPTSPTTPPTAPNIPQHHTTGPLVSGALGISVLVAAALMALVISATWKRYRTGPNPSGIGPRAFHQATDPLPCPETDPRRAVIAAYRAFEQEAATRGVPVSPPRTAGEIAHHQITTGLATPSTVQELTSVFQRARYSQHPIHEADQKHAERLLAEIRNEMEGSM